jgi:hypothetical protein
VRNGRTSERATSVTTSSASSSAPSAIAESRMASVRATEAWSLTAPVTAGVVRSISCAAIWSVACSDWVSSGLLTTGTAGSEMRAVRRTYSACSCWASCEPMPSTWLIPNSVDGSVPARVIIDVRSSGSGSSAPRLTSSCSIIIWPRAPTARVKPCVAVRMLASSTRTDPVMASSEVSRIGAYAWIRSRSPMVFEVTFSSSAWPPSNMLVIPVRTSGATSVSASRRCNSARLASKELTAA